MTDTHTVPTRLLDVSSQLVRLVTAIGNTATYTSLSYCWGSSPQLRTTRCNVEAHKQGITFCSLPTTFQHAIVVTRKIGVKYLWIDSLCIIQDSEVDKTTECSKMDIYYRHSYLTISALGAAGSTDGFLNARPNIPQARLFENDNLYLRPRTKPLPSIFKAAALSQRGWTLQERILSTRVLHYDLTEMIWECQSCSAREGSTREHDVRRNVFDPATFDGNAFKELRLSAAAGRLSDDNFGAVTIWYNLIQQYTRRKLTYSSDALPGILGLATNMAATTGYHSMSGLWQEDLFGLMWQVDHEGGESRHSYDLKYIPAEEGYNTTSMGPSLRGPTWSWAAPWKPVNFPFIYQRRTHSHKAASILNHIPSTATSGPSANLKSNFLALKASCKPISCYHPHHYEDRNAGLGLDFEVQMPYGAALAHFDRLTTSESLFRNEIHPTNEVVHVSTRSKAVMIMECVDDAAWSEPIDFTSQRISRKIAYFLIVVPDETVAGASRRVGMGWTYHTEVFEDCEPEVVNLT